MAARRGHKVKRGRQAVGLRVVEQAVVQLKDVLYLNAFKKVGGQLAFHEISKAKVFIGLIAEGGEELDRVYGEWQHALQSTPALLLVENTIRTDKYPLLNKHPDVIRFNRSSKKELNKTIQMVRAKINSASNRKESPFIREAAWFICGPIALDFLNMLPVHSF